MKKIKKKNYIILAILIIATVFVTLSCSKIYKIITASTTNFYQNANKINLNELDEYLLENSEIVFYISNKNDSSYSKFENDFEKYINKNNLKNKVIVIDSENTNDILDKLNNVYNLNLIDKEIPYILVILDKKVTKVVRVYKESDAINIINYEDLQ